MDEACDLPGAFLFHPKQHEEGPQLLRQHVSGEDHRHRLLRFLNGQRAGERLAAPEDLDEAGEGMRGADHIVLRNVSGFRGTRQERQNLQCDARQQHCNGNSAQAQKHLGQRRPIAGDGAVIEGA